MRFRRIIKICLCSTVVVLLLLIMFSDSSVDLPTDLNSSIVNHFRQLPDSPQSAEEESNSLDQTGNITSVQSVSSGEEVKETVAGLNEGGVADSKDAAIPMESTMGALSDVKAVTELNPSDVASTTSWSVKRVEALVDAVSSVGTEVEESFRHAAPVTIARTHVERLPVTVIPPVVGTENLTGGCEIPEGGFKAWSKGVVSTVAPDVPVSCSKVFTGDKDEVDRVKKAMEKWVNAVSNEDFTRDVRNCSWLRESFSNNMYNSKLEKAFPIAFTFVVYDSPQQVLRLMRLLYRPQNVYCIHPDLKSPYRAVFESIAECFDNVIIPSKLEKVVWGYYTILAAQMNCMRDLLKYRWRRIANKWQYMINLCGKELPLITNREMVARLLKLNGTSSLLTTPSGTDKKMLKRLKFATKVDGDNRLTTDHHARLKKRPFDPSSYHKSSSYNALSYDFTAFVLYNWRAKKYYEFFKKCSNPEEHFYATLYMQPGVPGGFDKKLQSNYFRIAEAYWVSTTKNKGYKCHGKVVHNVCIINAGDMSSVVQEGKNHLFFNKYFMDLDHTVMTCMEGRIVERNKLEYQEECGTV